MGQPAARVADMQVCPAKRCQGEEKVPATKSGESGQSRCANYPDLVAGTFFSILERS